MVIVGDIEPRATVLDGDGSAPGTFLRRVDGHDLAGDLRPIEGSSRVVLGDGDDARLDMRSRRIHRLREEVEHTEQGPAAHTDFGGLALEREGGEGEVVSARVQVEIPADRDEIIGKQT